MVVRVWQVVEGVIHRRSFFACEGGEGIDSLLVRSENASLLFSSCEDRESVQPH